MEQNRQQLPALTGMRFFLALWIVVYHQRPPLNSILPAWPDLCHALESTLKTGYSAVGIFFVLSGFVLAYNYDLQRICRPTAIARFGAARFSRIYPAYLIGLVLLIPTTLYRFFSGLIDSYDMGWETGAFFANLLLLQAWIPDMALSWNYPGWSLSNEASFYTAFPFIGSWLSRLNRISTLLKAGSLFWVLALVAPLLAVWIPIPHFGRAPATDIELPNAGLWANVIRYNPLLRLPDFCLGMVLAQVFRRVPRQNRLWRFGPWFYLPASTFALLAYATADHIPFPLMHNGLLLPLYACIVFGLALNGGPLAHLLSTRPMVFLGNVSYSMYILHVPIYTWLGLAFKHILHRSHEGWIWFVCYVLAVIIGSSVFYQFIEEPAHKFLRTRLSRMVPHPAGTPV